MLHTRKELYSILEQKEEKIRKLQDELSDLRVIAGYVGEKAELESAGLRPCGKLECVACSYSHRFRDRAGGWMVLCTKKSSCPDFIPKSLFKAD